VQYDYLCQNPLCSRVTEHSHPVAGFKEFHPPCPACGSSCSYEFNPTVIQFAIKDGPSGTSPSKALRIQKHMANKNESLKRKELDRYGHLNRNVLPNHQGRLTESWREAQSVAMQDKDFLEKNKTDSLAVAVTYNDKINKETKGDKKIVG
jgi:phage terminase large subunit GpA-like protein